MIDGGDGGDASDVTVDVDVPDGHDTDDADVIVVADPEDYNQSRRLKAIHTARADVRKAYREKKRFTLSEEHTEGNLEIARRVAFYGMELLPLMDEVGWSETLSDEYPWESVRHFIKALGQDPTGNEYELGTPPALSMGVFQKLNTFARSAGLGVDLDDGTDEWEV